MPEMPQPPPGQVYLPAKKQGLGAFLSKPFVMVALMAFLGMAAVLAFGAFYLLSARDFTPTPAQKECLVTASELSKVFPLTVDPAAETWSAERYFDGSLEIDYEYDDLSATAIYINSTVSVDPNISDAKISATSYWQGFKLGTNLAGASVDFEEANHIYRWGDSSRFAFLKTSGSRYAFAFIARKGTRVFFVSVYNTLLEDPSEIEAFLKPVLDRFELEPFSPAP